MFGFTTMVRANYSYYDNDGTYVTKNVVEKFDGDMKKAIEQVANEVSKIRNDLGERFDQWLVTCGCLYVEFGKGKVMPE